MQRAKFHYLLDKKGSSKTNHGDFSNVLPAEVFT